MRKRYLHDDYGQDELFWSKNWDRNWEKKYAGPPLIDRSIVGCIEKYLEPRKLLLEGGCGDCQYVRYFHQAGYNVIGVDFSKETVNKVKQLLPELDVRYGNILGLDFPDHYFDGYYSGGVIEHFEEFIDPQIQEAYRVLKPDGLFFVAVPHLNLIRRLTALFKRQTWKLDLDGRKTYHLENAGKFEKSIPPENYHFHEYVFSTAEMREFLRRNKFEIIDVVYLFADYGLLDIGWYRKLIGIDRGKRNIMHKAFALPFRIAVWAQKADNRFKRWIAHLLCGINGNIKLYVCRPVR